MAKGADRFEEIRDDLVARHPGVEPAQMMGMQSVKRDGKLVAGLVEDEDAMVFKLGDPGVLAEALALSGAHLFDPSGRGRPFKEWAVVPPRHAAKWPELAERALKHAG